MVRAVIRFLSGMFIAGRVFFFLPINVSCGRWLGMAYKEGYFKGCNEIREHLLNPTMLNADFFIQ